MINQLTKTIAIKCSNKYRTVSNSQ